MKTKLVLRLAGLLMVAGLAADTCGADFTISGIATGVLNTVRIDYPSDPGSYYTLLRGSNVAGVSQPVRMTLGLAGADSFFDDARSSGMPAAFYRIRRVPLTQPLDTDGDAVDDAYELAHQGILDPLNGVDAAEDFDRDGDSNYLEYRNGTDPEDHYNGLFPLTWSLVNPGGIQVRPLEDAWHAGRMDDLLPVPGGVVAAGDYGGAWLITHGAGIAFPLSDDWDKPQLGCLARGPDGPYHLFAGGIKALHETDVTQASPLFHWREIPLPAYIKEVYQILVVPGRRAIVLATDRGVEWSSIPSSGSPVGAYYWVRVQGLPGGAISSLALGPNDTVIAGAFGVDLNLGRYGIFRGAFSNDGLVFTRSVINGADPTRMYRTRLAACEGNPAFIYATSAAADGKLYHILRSTDGGATWNPCNRAATLPVAPFNGDLRDLLGDQGNDRNGCLGVAAHNPNRLAVGWVGGPYVSSDAGNSWSIVAPNPHVHADVTSIHFDPADAQDRTFWVTSDGGVVGTTDFGATFSSVYNQHLSNLQFLHGEPVIQWGGSLGVGDFNGLFIAGGLQDNGNIFTWLGGGYAPWRQYRGGDGGLHAMLPSGTLLDKQSGPNDVQLASIHWDPFQGNLVNPGYPLTRPGNAKILYYAAALVNEPAWANPSGQLMYAVACDATNIYGVFENPDGTDTHLEWLGAVPPDQGTKPRSIGSWDGSRILVGTLDGRLFAINSADSSRVELTLPQPSPPSAGVSVVGYLAFESAQVIYAAGYNSGSSRLYVSTDGNNFTRITNGPSDKVFNGLAVDTATSPAGVFVSSDDVVYLTFDRGQTWRNASAGLPRRAFCGDLRVITIGDAWARYLCLGTFGRSAWVAQLADYARYPLSTPGTPFSGNFIQSTWGNQGNFDLLVPRGDMVYHYFRDNDAGGFPWHFKACLPKPGGTSPATTPFAPASVSLIQSRPGNAGYPGDLVAVVRWNYLLPGLNQLFAYTFSSVTKKWSAPRPILADGLFISGSTGDPALFQSTYGANGNYELLVPQGQVIKHYARDNDAPNHPWHYLRSLPTGIVDTNQQVQTHVPVNVAVMQGNFGSPGNFEAVVRMEPIALGQSFLAFYYFDTTQGVWVGPFPLYADGVQITNVTGNPALIQGPYGVKGNFELLVPQGDHVTHYWRDNDDPNFPWHRAGILPTGIVDPNQALTHVPADVALIPSNFADPGKLQAVVRMTPLASGSPFLRSYYFDIGTLRWYGPFTISAEGQTVAGVTGF